MGKLIDLKFPEYGFTCKRQIPISGNRFMLCGDAASLINPAMGGGIGQAMQSGSYAGCQALKCFEKIEYSCQFRIKKQNYKQDNFETPRILSNKTDSD